MDVPVDVNNPQPVNNENVLHPRIQRLPQSVINRIAAGEVVIRPAAALKELLENSLDAGATNINVTARDGGLRQLRIEDDGVGISEDNLTLLCQRFATSKLRSYDDLAGGNVTTFGFRGEALASIAHVARLSVVTRLVENAVAYTANYSDSGQLLRDPKPCARGKHGTTIIVDDLFYNIPTRRVALQSPSDEYRAIVDVVIRYSIRYPNVGFSCKKLTGGKGGSSAVADVCTSKDATSLQNIRAAFGGVVAAQTTEFEVDMKEIDAKLKAVVSTSNFSMRRGIYVFFINGRLVDCNTLKRAIAAAYSPFLPKSSQPFAYVDLNIPAKDIDVNVHPMKKEVRFLNEDFIVEVLISEITKRLKNSETSRTFFTQTVLVPKSQALSLSQSLSPPEIGPDPSKIDKEETVNDISGNSRNRDGHDRALRSGNRTVSNTELLQVTTPQRVKRREGDDAPDDGDGDISRMEDDDDADPDEPTKEIDDKDGDYINDGVVVEDEDNSESDEDISDHVRRKDCVRFEQGEMIAKAKSDTAGGPSQNSSPATREYAKDKVRTSGNKAVGLLDKYVTTVGSNGSDKKNQRGMAIKGGRKPRRLKRRACAPPLLTSVEGLLNAIQRGADRKMMESFREHSFVGVVSREFALIQHGIQLLLADIEPLVQHLAYETLLRRFADHAEVAELTPGAPVCRLIDKHVKGLHRKSADMELVDSESCTNLLREKGPMLEEYFGLKFEQVNSESDLVLRSVPILFDRVMPGVEGLGHMLYDMATKTDWSEEAVCFDGVARVIGNWYGAWWQPVPSSSGGDKSDVVVVDKSRLKEGRVWDGEDREWVLRHVLFDSMRSEFYLPRTLVKQNVVREITSTAKLYKIFERC